MTETEFLERHAERLRDRLRRRSSNLQETLGNALAPAVREHPRTSIAIGAATGFLVGRLLGPVGLARTARGVLGGSVGFLRNTGLFALRSVLVNPFLSGGDGESS